MDCGSVWMNESFDPVCRRCAPLAPCPAWVNDVRTASSRPNSRNAAMMDTSVRKVRVLRRKSDAQTRCRYFIASPSSCDRFDEAALVEVQRVVGVLGGLWIVGDHQHRLTVVAVERAQEAQHLLGRLAVEVTGGLVADEQGRVGDDCARDRDALVVDEAGSLLLELVTHFDGCLAPSVRRHDGDYVGRDLPVRVGAQHGLGRHVGLDLADVGLAHIDVDLQRIHVDDGADAGAREAAAGRKRRDDLADLRRLDGDDAGERRTHHGIVEIHPGLRHLRTRREADSARAQVAQARVNFDYAVVRAPFSGVITVKAAQVGEIVSPLSAGGGFTRTGVGTIVDMDSLEIDVDVSEAYIGQVKPDMPAEAVLSAYPDWKIPAHVIAIVPSDARGKATVKVRDELEQKAARLVHDQRVSIARAIVSDPTLLVCDEPTGDLDRQSAEEVLGLLRALNRDHGKTVLMVTHDPKAAEYANHTLHLDKGSLVEAVAA